ncbi:F0F1 ATP synthase subunit gamma [Magnetococcales bacterium HHB-1]
MANLKELRIRIRSVSNTQQITKAMKMVAAAKLRRSQDNAMNARPYSEAMGRMIQSLGSVGGSDDANASPLLYDPGPNSKKVELVAFSADRGLCGGFNSSIVRAVQAKVAELEGEGKDFTITCVGRKAYDVLKRRYSSKIRKLHTDMMKDLTFEKAEREIALDLMTAHEEGVFDTCYIVYNEFQSAMVQNLTWKKLIPVSFDEDDAGQQDKADQLSGSYYFEPEEDEMLDILLPKNLTVQIYQALVESDASEHGARMTAMDNAVRNAAEMIRKLQITFNRTRQAAITTELMEIIGGAESLKG